MNDLDKLTLENIDMQFCSDWLKEQIRKLLEENKRMGDALLNADRYFKTKDGVYFCDVELCETAAKYAVEQAIKESEKV